MSTFNDKASELLSASLSEATSHFNDTISVLSDLISDQKAAMDANFSQWEALNQSLVLHESDSIDFSTPLGANSDDIEELRDQLLAEQAEIAELVEGYTASLQRTQMGMEQFQQIYDQIYDSLSLV